MNDKRAFSREVITPVRVRYADTDQMGVVYYANYLVWFEVGRTEWLRAQGSSYADIERDGFVFPVIEARCEYRMSLRYDDEVDIRTRARLVTAVRVEFHYSIVRRRDSVVAAEGFTGHAVTDTAGRPRRLPAVIRRLFP
jgi:acyl-CoA thioester hydrolase